MIRIAAVLVLSALLATPQAIDATEIHVKSQAYAPRSAHAFRVDTKLVEIGVVVRDGKGRVVSGLGKENFQIYDNGKEREVADFAVDSTHLETTKPLESETSRRADPGPALNALRPQFIALYFDDVNSKEEQHSNDLKQTQDAAKKFLAEALQPGVQVGVFTASGTQTLDFTADTAKLLQSIESVRAHPQLSESGVTRCPRVTPYLAYMIAVQRDPAAITEVGYSASTDLCTTTRAEIISQAEDTWRRMKEISTETLDSIGRVTDRLAAMPGSRVLLLASSGFFTATLEQQRDQIIGHALHAGVVINALDSKGVYGESLAGSRPQDGTIVSLHGQGRETTKASARFNVIQLGLRAETLNEPLATLAEGTGGVFFHNNNDLQAGFRELAASPEATYRLSFRLPEGFTDGTWHKLKVKLVHARYESVHARPGYFAPAGKAADETENVPSRFEKEVMAADTITDFPVDISAQDGKLPSGETTVIVVASVDISKLRFTQQGDRQTQKIRLVSALMDAKGAIVTAKEATMDLALKADTYKRLAKTGLNAKLTLQASPGVYALREVVEEADGRIACSTHPIEIR